MLFDFLQEQVLWVSLSVMLATGLGWLFFTSANYALEPITAVVRVNKEEGLFIDLRAETEYTKGHIPNSLQLSEQSFKAKLPDMLKPYKEKLVVLVNQNGVGLNQKAELLQKHGIAQARVLVGGIVGWQAANLPLVKPESAGSKKRAKKNNKI